MRLASPDSPAKILASIAGEERAHCNQSQKSVTSQREAKAAQARNGIDGEDPSSLLDGVPLCLGRSLVVHRAATNAALIYLHKGLRPWSFTGKEIIFLTAADHAVRRTIVLIALHLLTRRSAPNSRHDPAFGCDQSFAKLVDLRVHISGVRNGAADRLPDKSGILFPQTVDQRLGRDRGDAHFQLGGGFFIRRDVLCIDGARMLLALGR